MTTSLPQEAIIDYFSRFLTHITDSKPYSDTFNTHFQGLLKTLQDNDPSLTKAQYFLKSLKTKLSPEPELSKPEPTKDEDLKTFHQNRLVSGMSIIKFNQILFRDYVIKNSILLPEESKLLYRFSHIKEFLPDSQNFYRVIGIGLFEAYLTNDQYKDRLRKAYDLVYDNELILSTKFYPYSSNELRVTFCGYLNQLSKLVEETQSCKRVRDLLYDMCNRDSMFDMSLISYMKELIMSKTKGKDGKFEVNDKGKPQNEYAIITELLPSIPEAIGLNLIVEVVHDNRVKELIYPSRNPRENPNLNIINERQLTYENYHILSFEEQDDEYEVAGSIKVSNSKTLGSQNSVQNFKSLITKTEPSESLKKRSPKDKPLSLHNLSNDEIKSYKPINEGTYSSKNTSSKPLLTTGANELISNSYRTPILSNNSSNTIEKKSGDVSDFKLSDRKSTDILTPSRNKYNIASIDLYTNINTENPLRSDRKIVQTSPSARVNLSINNDVGVTTPNGKLNKNLIGQYGLPQSRTPRADENYYSSPSNARVERRSPNINKIDVNTLGKPTLEIPRITVDVSKNRTMDSVDKKLEDIRKKIPQVKIQTMIPMSMDTLPSNPFSTFQVTNGFSSDKYQYSSTTNTLGDYRTSSVGYEDYQERRTIGNEGDKIYNTIHSGGSGNNSFRRNTATYNNQNGLTTKVASNNLSYDTKTRKIV